MSHQDPQGHLLAPVGRQQTNTSYQNDSVSHSPNSKHGDDTNDGTTTALLPQFKTPSPGRRSERISQSLAKYKYI